MLFHASSAHGTRVCGVTYWRAHDQSCLENFVKEPLACNLLCKPVWTAPSTPPLLSISNCVTHTRTGDLPGVECRWCHWVGVRRAIPSRSAESWSRGGRRQRLSLSCTTQFSISCERDHVTVFILAKLNALVNLADNRASLTQWHLSRLDLLTTTVLLLLQ